jgi:transposase
MRPSGSAAELEARRLRAVSLLADGLSIAEVARRFGVDRSSVKRWKRAMSAGGVEALAARPNLGRRPLLSIEQKNELARIVREGPRAAGFATELWTLPRLVKVIRERFGVTYHFSHVGRLLKKLGFTRQKPVFRATQRDEVAIARWRSHDWPRIKKRLEDAARPSSSSTRPAFCCVR